MGFKKVSAKGRLDKWYKLAKEKGYRARAAFKLIQLNKKYHVLEKSRVLIDLCAAPGSWCQVASEVMPPNSLIIGVDLAPIKPIPRCILFQSDITTDKCRATLRQHLKTLKADTVLHDGAPNVGTAWVQDAFSQAALVLQSLRLATDFLAPGGTFITKVFRSKDYNALLWVFKQLFGSVESTKPPSSRNVSAEIFVVCREYKAPKKIDPRFLDPKSVFAELLDPIPNNEAKVYNPEKKKRRREGYAEDDWTLYKEIPVSEFIQTTDPIAVLGSINKLSFEKNPNGDLALATLERLPETTEEVRRCCADLKVLGRKDFKLLLKWRLKVREQFGFPTKKSKAEEAVKDQEVAEVESMDEEMQFQEDLQKMKEQSDVRRKREKRRENERKQKEIVRMQMNMTTPMDIGIEQAGPNGEDAMFALKTVGKSDQPRRIINGKMHVVEAKVGSESESEQEESEDEDEDRLEAQLDSMYEQYQEKRAEADAKYRAKKARKEHKDDEFQDFSDREVSDGEDILEDKESEDDEDDDEAGEDKSLFNQLPIRDGDTEGLSKRATLFFDQDIFKSIDGLDISTHDDSGIEMDEDSGETNDKACSSKSEPVQETKKSKLSIQQSLHVSKGYASDDNSDSGFEVVKRASPDPWIEGENPEPRKNGRPDVDIITAEAMTLAHAIATGSQTKQSLMDENFNKYTLRDTEGLPDWFLDDENEHSKPHRPITAAAAAAIKEKLRAFNARPIKKVREAKARKKFKAAQKLEKLKKKSALLVEDTDISEKDKARAIEKMMAKASKSKPHTKPKLVIAKGVNRGLKGRPRGTKGRYKMVDSRMKKDIRGEKRAAKKRK